MTRAAPDSGDDKIMKYEVPFVDYYKQHGISPVSQDISDKNRHFFRRNALYRHLGLPSGLLRGRKVLEFGPGSGHNALFTASAGPSVYVLVDGNPVGLKRAQELLPLNEGSEFIFVESLIENYAPDEKFDLVICEGLLPHQKNPAEMLKHVASFVSEDGILLITCVDSVSSLSDLLRHYAGNIICCEHRDFEEKSRVLCSVFKEHLQSLEFASRPVEDWVQDNILHPLTNKLFSIQGAITALRDDFDILGVSPHFFTDWRWYKQICDKDGKFNDLMTERYQRNLHMLINRHSAPSEREASLNMLLLQKTDRVFEIINMTDAGNKPDLYMAEMLEAVNSLKEEVRSFDSETFDALVDYISFLENVPKHGGKYNWGSFTSFWGKGQQNLSFVRKYNGI
jgi:2-polyprenyl-3-methyl-5-hydroxy-6-metoxy-1,4-benzoquinol methylase